MFSNKEFPNPTMDNLETASNISDNHSECLSSNLSSLSGLTGYEEELYDLKHLIKHTSPNPVVRSNDNHHGHLEVFEERIKILNTELQNALRLNEKYKNDMSNLERQTELAFHEKFEKLMRRNAQLEAQLSVANDRIHNFFKNVSESNKHNRAEIEQKITHLEKQDFELNSKIDLLKSEVKHWRKEAETNEAAKNRFKLEVEEIKIVMSTKTSSIDALKSKIVDLHLEMQNLNQDNVKVSNLLAITSNELDSFKKSEKWYKEQLHQCRGQKSVASEEISRLQSLLIVKERDLDLRNSDLIRLKNTCDELQLTTLQEKQNLLKTIDKLQRKALNTGETPKITEDRNLSENYESTIESLTRELVAIKEAINEQQSTFATINKQNSELMARNTTLQKTLNGKEISFDNLESDKQDLIMRLEILTERLRENEGLLMKAVNEKSEIEVALSGANREKREIEDAVGTIRENFSKLVVNYNKTKEELCEKNNLILELGFGSKQLMEANRKIEELERVKLELNQKVLELQNGQITFDSCSKQLEEANGKIKELERVNLNFHEQILEQVVFKQETKQIIAQMQNKTENINNDLEKTKADLEKAIGAKEKLEGEIVSFRKITTNLEKELQGHKDILQLNDKEINNLRNNSVLHEQAARDLKNELNVVEKSLSDSHKKLDEVDELNKFLQMENSELKDKIAKFVANNFNGFNNKQKKDEISTTAIEQHELDLWFSNILDWICSNLLEIQTQNGLKQNTFVSKLPEQLTNKRIEELLGRIDQLLVSISSRGFAEFEERQQISFANKQLKQKLSKIKDEVLERLSGLEDKCHLLRVRQEKDLEALETIKNLENGQILSSDPKKELGDELKQLKILYKAKELENSEKRKRYEVNNRTLLKKVKEHMRGRNSAEKRCSYLQELYNNVYDELNTYKLQENSKNAEIQNLQNAYENYKTINVKMKQDLLKIEKELAVAEATKVCVYCIEYEPLKKNAADLELKLKICEDHLKQKETFLNNIQIEIQQTIRDKATLEKENRILLEEIENLNDELNERKETAVKLELTLEKDRKAMEELHEKVLEEQKLHSACVMQLEGAQKLSQHTQDKNELLCEEIEVLSRKLNHSNNEYNNLQVQKNLLENAWSQKETHMQTFTTNLQSEMQKLQNDLISARSDKHFLQRLCNDLKLALQTCMNQSKVLKKHIETLSSESRECNSLPEPMINLPSPSKYDDAYINQLLKQSSATPNEKPLGDLQNCLNSLKKEMICLRKQVTERAGYQM